MELKHFKKTMESAKIAPLKVFILEDDLEIGLIVERVLKNIDPYLSLDWATSAESALAQLEITLKEETFIPYDLIIADIFLDGESTGIDFWRNCHELFPNTPFVVTSALNFDRFFSTIGRHSISPPYLQKPFTPAECKQMF